MDAATSFCHPIPGCDDPPQATRLSPAAAIRESARLGAIEREAEATGPGRARAVLAYDLIEIALGFASSAFGTSIVSTPSRKLALTRSVSALAGSVNERLNEP